MLVRIQTDTCYCGEHFDDVYEFPDGTTERELDIFGDELATERAFEFGTFDHAEEDEVDPDITCTIEIIPEERRNEILEWYGEILLPENMGM